jgi:hypothetical protein
MKRIVHQWVKTFCRQLTKLSEATLLYTKLWGIIHFSHLKDFCTVEISFIKINRQFYKMCPKYIYKAEVIC